MEDIIAHVRASDYQFFLKEKNFLKVVDTLEKFQERAIDLDSQAGRDFIVFKRQLYSLYEVKNRSVSEHEAFSFELQRENLKWLWNANQDYSKEMERLNALEDLTAHANLNGAIFKRKAMSPARLYGLGCFGAAGMTYAYFPLIANLVGYSASLFGLTAASVMGMINLNEKNVINSIHFVEGGDLKINVSTNAFASRDILVS